MKLLSCFSRIEEMAPLAGAGADELYCAVSGFPSYGLASRLETSRLKAALKRAHDLGVKLSLAVNSMYLSYDARGWKRFGERLLELDRAGMDGFIVSSPAFFELAREIGPFKAAIYLSSVQPCFNSAAAAMFIRLGVSRIILPNQLTGPEAAQIIRFCSSAGVKTELFDYRFFGCGYINGRCKLHRPVFHSFRDIRQAGELCRIGGRGGDVQVEAFDRAPDRSKELRAVAGRVFERVNSGGPVRLGGAGVFFDAFAAGAAFLKYGTRSDPPDIKERKVKAMKEMIALARAVKEELGAVEGRAAFARRMRGWDPVRLRILSL